MSLRRVDAVTLTGAGEGPSQAEGPSPEGPLARWRKPLLGFSVFIDSALQRFNSWSVSARSEFIQSKHGVNESAYDTARKVKQKINFAIAHIKKAEKLYSPNEKFKSFGLCFSLLRMGQTQCQHLLYARFGRCLRSHSGANQKSSPEGNFFACFG